MTARQKVIDFDTHPAGGGKDADDIDGDQLEGEGQVLLLNLGQRLYQLTSRPMPAAAIMGGIDRIRVASAPWQSSSELPVQPWLFSPVTGN